MKPALLAAWLFALAAGTGPLFAQAQAQAPAPASGNPAPATAGAAPAAKGAPIDVWEFAVEGNSVLPVPVIEQAVMPFLGPQRQIEDLEAARAALERAYQTRGFLTVFVDLPEQRVDDGVVRLQVLEGRIARTSVTGSRYYSQGYIRDKVPSFAEGTVPNFNTAQKELALVNRTEQRRVQPVLKPGFEPGTVEVEMKVADQLPVSGSVDVNNNHAVGTDPWRLQATLRYDNLFQRDHAIALTGVVAPRDPAQTTALILNYSVPLDNGDSIIAYGVISNSQVDTLGGTTVLGDGTTLGLRYAIPFEAGGGLHSVALGVDYKNLNEQVTFGSDTLSTPLKYLPFQATYNGNWTGKDSQTTVTSTLLAASRTLLQTELPCGSEVPVDQFACKRFGADGSFATLRLGATHSMALGPASLALRLAGQLTAQPLPSSEQFTIGGVGTVRGYYEGEAAGDTGLVGSIELRSPNWAPAAEPPGEPATLGGELSEITLYAFTDGGRVQLISPLPGQQRLVPLLSAGAGLRLTGRSRWALGMDWAVPLKTTAATSSGDSVINVRLGWRY